MIEHLSAEQISQWMMGERSWQLQQHVAGCAECRAELEEMESALSQFRAAMRGQAQSLPAPTWRELALEPAHAWWSWQRAVLAAAMLLLLIGIPAVWRVHVRQQEQAAAAAAIADSQLLESVDSAISQAVPEPMEPLVSLVAWNSNSAEAQNQKGQKQ